MSVVAVGVAVRMTVRVAVGERVRVVVGVRSQHDANYKKHLTVTLHHPNPTTSPSLLPPRPCPALCTSWMAHRGW